MAYGISNSNGTKSWDMNGIVELCKTDRSLRIIDNNGLVAARSKNCFHTTNTGE